MLFGTIDSWLIWNLTGRHVTDVTNASRTMLMNLHTPRVGRRAARGDRRAARDAPRDPAVVGDLRRGRRAAGRCAGRRRCSATSRRRWSARPALTPARPSARTGPAASCCSTPASSRPARRQGCSRTVGYDLGSGPPTYALEGSIAVTGALVQWFRDNVGLIGSAPEIETLALTVEDNGGCYFVPAFSGLFAPHWRSDARGVIAGLTGYITKGHLARAVLEATAWQTREVVEAMTPTTGGGLLAAAGRRRHDRQQPADAVARRRARRAGGAPDRRRDRVARRRLCRRTRGRLLARPRQPRDRTGTRPPSGCRRWIRRSATRATASGRRPWRAPSTGSTTTTDLRGSQDRAARQRLRRPSRSRRTAGRCGSRR